VERKSKEYADYRQKTGRKKWMLRIEILLDRCGQICFSCRARRCVLQYASQEKFLTPERDREYAAIVSEPRNSNCMTRRTR